MTVEDDPADIAGALLRGISLLVRTIRQTPDDAGLTLPETSALARLDRGGPTTSSALAKLEQISAQSMGATLGALERRGLVERRPDPADGRRVVLSITAAGVEVVNDRRGARADRLAVALAAGFTRSELAALRTAAPLIERLAQSI